MRTFACATNYVKYTSCNAKLRRLRLAYAYTLNLVGLCCKMLRAQHTAPAPLPRADLTSQSDDGTCGELIKSSHHQDADYVISDGLVVAEHFEAEYDETETLFLPQ